MNVTIAEVGIWRNLITPDDGVRKANLAFAAEKLAVADAVGARCAVSGRRLCDRARPYLLSRR